MIGIYLRGMAMGAADIIPGVSGGTIAFIAGIYERLIDALGSVGPQLWQTFRKQGPGAAWQQFDGTFLCVLFAGVLTSVLLAARMITWLLTDYGPVVWSFFGGLIIGSVFYLARQIDGRGPRLWIAGVLAAAAAYGITMLTPGEILLTPLTLFLAGAIAICAMILPGISGSFLLLMMGMYEPILNAVKTLQLGTLSIFGLGCVVGLLSFTKVLKWLLHHYHAVTLAALTGFMVGALNKVWPWKEVLTTRLNSKGELVPLLEANVLPGKWSALNGGESPMLLGAVLAFAVGLLLVLAMAAMERRSQHGTTQRPAA